MTEEELIVKFRTLDEDGKRRVLRYINDEYKDTIAGRLEALRDGEKATEKRTR